MLRAGGRPWGPGGATAHPCRRPLHGHRRRPGTLAASGAEPAVACCRCRCWWSGAARKASEAGRKPPALTPGLPKLPGCRALGAAGGASCAASFQRACMEVGWMAQSQRLSRQGMCMLPPVLTGSKGGATPSWAEAASAVAAPLRQQLRWCSHRRSRGRCPRLARAPQRHPRHAARQARPGGGTQASPAAAAAAAAAVVTALLQLPAG